MYSFQFTRPRGARLANGIPAAAKESVSIHAPTGGATHQDRLQAEAICFNSRAHGGRDARPSPCAGCPCGFQFTRPRGARPCACSRFACARVSIHAPTGGATGRDRAAQIFRLFQFTRPRGARRAAAEGKAVAKWFQFTRPRGARHQRVSHASVPYVSIHAPTGGATLDARGAARREEFQFTRPRGARRPRRLAVPAKRRFNSRAHGGRDASSHSAATKDLFQFTRPRGARPWQYPHPRAWRRFNSRAHGGRDVRKPN